MKTDRKTRKVVLRQTGTSLFGWTLEVDGVNLSDYVDDIKIHIESKDRIASLTMHMLLAPSELDVYVDAEVKLMIEELQEDGSGSEQKD